MKLISDGKFYSVPEELIPDRSLFANYTKSKSSKYVRVENSLISEIVLEYIVEEPIQFVRDRVEVVDESLEVDKKIVEHLRDYQVRDVEFMLKHRNCLNRNRMGLGKTVEAVALMRSLNAQSALIVAPKSTLLQWKKKIEEWWPEASDRVELLSKNPKPGSICLYNYDQLSRNGNLIETLRSRVWSLFICDEAHRIKNPNSKRTLAVKSIPATRKLALTGTPIMSRPNDLWSILNWLDVRYSGRSYWDFVYYFCEIEKGFWGNSIKGLTEDVFRVSVLRKLLKRVSISNKVNVASGKTIETVSLVMAKDQATLFKKTKQLMLDELPETITVANGAVLCTRLQQISSWPGVFSTEDKQFGPGSKFEWIQELLDDNPEEKIVVYTRFETVATALQKFLTQRCVVYTGKLSHQERERSKKLFIECDEVRVIVGTIGAMGEGVDGLQYASRTAVFIDRDWVPSVMEQCEDRLNRFGQKYPVMCYYLECEKSFDQHVGKINQSKAEDIRRVLSEK